MSTAEWDVDYAMSDDDLSLVFDACSKFDNNIQRLILDDICYFDFSFIKYYNDIIMHNTKKYLIEYRHLYLEVPYYSFLARRPLPLGSG